MKLNEAYNIVNEENNEEILVETNKNELVELFKRVKQKKMTEGAAMNFIKNGANYTRLTNGLKKSDFILKGFSPDKSKWVEEYKSCFNQSDQQAAEAFFKKVLKAAFENLENINKTRRSDAETSAASSKERHEEKMRRLMK